MAIQTWAALRIKLTQLIRGFSTGAPDKTKAIEHREFEADFIDTVESKINEVGTAAGATGDVQVKGSDGKLTGSSSFNFLSGLLSLVGNFFLKGASSTLGNAFEVRNGGNVSHFTVSNDGKVCVKNIHAINESLEIYAYRGIYLNSAFGYIASFERFNTIQFFAPVKAPSFTANQVTTEIVKGIDDNFPEGSTRNESGVSILDGKPKSDEFGFGDYDGLGVSISSHIGQEGGEPILIKTIEVKGGKLGLYGVEPVARQVLSVNPTTSEISAVLLNLGIVIRP